MPSFENSISQDSDNTEKKETVQYELKTKNRETLIVQENEKGIFQVIGNSVTEEGDPIVKSTQLSFIGWDSDVEDLDAGHSDASVLGGSVLLKYKEVQFTPKEIKAPSVEDLKEALLKVGIRRYCMGDI